MSTLEKERQMQVTQNEGNDKPRDRDQQADELEHNAMVDLAVAALVRGGYVEALTTEDGEVVYRSIRPFRANEAELAWLNA